MSQTLSFFQKLAKRYSTPKKVQQLLREMKYNGEEDGETVRSAMEAYRAGKAHCLEACLISAAILEHRGYPPIVLNLDSKDYLNHALFVFKEKTGWGAIGRSRENGLHGRAPRYRSIKELAWSYFDPYVDDTGRLVGYELANLEDSQTDWRGSPRNVWKVEKLVTTLKFRKMVSSNRRFKKLYQNYQKNGSVKFQSTWW